MCISMLLVKNNLYLIYTEPESLYLDQKRPKNLYRTPGLHLSCYFFVVKIFLTNPPTRLVIKIVGMDIIIYLVVVYPLNHPMSAIASELLAHTSNPS